MRIFKASAEGIMCPEIIQSSTLAKAGFGPENIGRYEGLKEHVYISSFVPRAGFRSKLGVPDDAVMVTIRPPSMT